MGIGFEKFPHSPAGDSSSIQSRVAVNTSADATESNRLDAIVLSQRQRSLVTASQLLLHPGTAIINGSNGVNDVGSRQFIAFCNDSLADCTCNTESPALSEQARPSGLVNRTIDAAAAEQAGLCGVDDGISSELGDVAFPDADDVVDGGRGRDYKIGGCRDALVQLSGVIERGDGGDRVDAVAERHIVEKLAGAQH